MSDVIIEMRGGNVVGVYGDAQETHVTIIDWDNWEAGDISTSVNNVDCLPTSRISEETKNIIALNKTSRVD